MYDMSFDTQRLGKQITWVSRCDLPRPLYVAVPIRATIDWHRALGPITPRAATQARSGERLISACLLPFFQIHARLVCDLFRRKPALA